MWKVAESYEIHYKVSGKLRNVTENAKSSGKLQEIEKNCGQWQKLRCPQEGR